MARQLERLGVGGQAVLLEADVVRVAAYTGLRIGELRVLRWRDGDFANVTLARPPQRPDVEEAALGHRLEAAAVEDRGGAVGGAAVQRLAAPDRAR